MKKLCKVLPNTQETKVYLESLPKIYLVACWAKYGVMEFPFAGRYKYDKFRSYKEVPLVYNYDDRNGTEDAYFLIPITFTTSGIIASWTFDRDEAYRIAEKKNKETKR